MISIRSLNSSWHAKWTWLLIAFTTAWVTACGGGAGAEGTGSFGYTAGPVSGFGSIIVNDIRFDDAAAVVVDEDGNAVNKDDLRLGMTVEVDSGAVTVAVGGSSAVASKVRLVTALVGVVSARDAVAGTLTVFGQPVRTTTSTVFDDRLAGGLASIAIGSELTVYGLLDTASGIVTATRIEPIASPAAYRIRGVVSLLDTAALTFHIGSEVFSYTVATAPAGLANGAIVRLRVAPVPDALGRWVVGGSSAAVRVPEDDTETKVEGRVNVFTSSASFQVDGLSVDASAAQFDPNAAAVVLGARVEVEGTTVGGVLRATKVKVQSDDGGSGGGGGDQEIEIHGSITSVDAPTQSFVVRNTTIVYDAATEFQDGTAADLAVGRAVELKGTLAAGQSSVLAQQIKFE